MILLQACDSSTNTAGEFVSGLFTHVLRIGANNSRAAVADTEIKQSFGTIVKQQSERTGTVIVLRQTQVTTRASAGA